MTTNPQEPQAANSQKGGMQVGVQQLISLRDMQEVLGIGSTKAYELVASGEIPSVRIGRAIRVSVDALQSWLEQQAYKPHE